MEYCKNCGNHTVTMSGTIYLEPDAEPYESGVEELTKTNIDEIDRHILAQYCEHCDEIIETYNT